MFIGGIARDNDGNIYLSDAKLGLIKKFSPTYQLLQTWGGLGTGDGQFGTVGFQPAVRWQNWSHVGAGGMCFNAAQELVVAEQTDIIHLEIQALLLEYLLNFIYTFKEKI